MPSIDRIDEKGAVVGQVELADGLLREQVNIGLLHQVVTAELAGHRQGTSSAKGRSEVAGSGAKQWRQKGTGRARVGSGKVSQFTGGGVAFPPVPRSYAMKINKKVKAQAFRMALADLVAGGTVKVVSGSLFAEPSAKQAAALVEQAAVQKPLLVLTAGDEIAALKSFRNLTGTRALPVGEAEVQDYVWAKSLLFTEAAVSFLQAGLDRESGEAAAVAPAPPAPTAAPAPAPSEAPVRKARARKAPAGEVGADAVTSEAAPATTAEAAPGEGGEA